MEVEEGGRGAGDKLAELIPGFVGVEGDVVKGAIFVEGDGEDAVSSGGHCSPFG